jgi:hypothetical protein
MDIIINQLVGLLTAHFYSMLTLPLTSWLSCSVLLFANQLVRLFAISSSATLGLAS